MKVVAGPTSVYVNEPGNEGITGTVTLATSHASIHVWDNVKPAMFQFDLYSWFGLEKATWTMIDRNRDVFFELSSGKWEKGAGVKSVAPKENFY